MPDPDRPTDRVVILGVRGLPEVSAGADLAAMIVTALDDAGQALRDGDVLVVSSKVVSKAEGRTVRATTRDDAIAAETVRVVAERSSGRGLTRIVQARSGPVMAAAGVDASNVPTGTVLLLPADPDASARTLRKALEAASGARIGLVVSDTAGRAWRDGQVDLALGAAGLLVTDDLRGAVDGFGNPLEVTVRALVDELASAADLVKGKLAGVPVAVVRGLGGLVTAEDGPGARALLRAPGTDWFALGHVEAVRSSLGVPPGTAGVAPAPVVPDDAAARLRRALDVALAGRPPLGSTPPVTADVTAYDPTTATLTLTVGPADPDRAPHTDTDTDTDTDRANDTDRTPDTDHALGLGALAQRLVAAAWAEGLSAGPTQLTGDRLTLTTHLA